jgi:hypothetical protein
MELSRRLFMIICKITLNFIVDHHQQAAPLRWTLSNKYLGINTKHAYTAVPITPVDPVYSQFRLCVISNSMPKTSYDSFLIQLLGRPNPNPKCTPYIQSTVSHDCRPIHSVVRPYQSLYHEKYDITRDTPNTKGNPSTPRIFTQLSAVARREHWNHRFEDSYAPHCDHSHIFPSNIRRRGFAFQFHYHHDQQLHS